MGNLFLVGFMGCGKSTVGRLLAERTSVPFVDMDTEIEQRLGCTIAELFDREGEHAFRVSETALLHELVEMPSVVVATGGGCFCSEVNRRIIHESGGESVLLDVPWPVLEQRAAGDGDAGASPGTRGVGCTWTERPLFRDREAARALYLSREPAYRQALVTLDLEGSEDVSEVVERLLRLLQEVRCAT